MDWENTRLKQRHFRVSCLPESLVNVFLRKYLYFLTCTFTKHFVFIIKYDNSITRNISAINNRSSRSCIIVCFAKGLKNTNML